jgi:hypothetical protein
LSIAPVGNSNVIEKTSKNEIVPLYLEVNFTGYEGAKIEAAPTIDIGLNSFKDENMEIDSLSEEEKVTINAREDASYYKVVNNVDFTKCLYNVVEVSALWNKLNNDIEADETLTLKSYYPVA